MPCVVWAAGCGAWVGRFARALDSRQPRRHGWTSFALGEGFMAMMALLMLTIPHLLVYGFLDESDPRNAEVISLAVSFLAVAALFQIVAGAQAVDDGTLRRIHAPHMQRIYAAL